MINRTLTLVAGLAALWPLTVDAQTRIDDRPTCGGCRLSLERVTTLSGPLLEGEPKAITRSTTGHYFVSFYPSQGRVVEFGPDGQALRVLLPNGEGPGEVRRAAELTTRPGDTLVVYEAGRVQFVSLDDEGVRTERLPLPIVSNALDLGERHLINVGAVFSRDAVQPLHLVDSGRVDASFGGDPNVRVAPTAPYLLMRSLDHADEDRVWSAELATPRISEWDLSGRLRGDWVLDAEWFRPWTELRPVGAAEPPDARLLDIAALPGRRLLVLFAVPAPDWRDHLGDPAPGSERPARYPSADLTRVLRPRLLVLDLELGVVLAMSDDVGSGTRFLDAEYLSGYREGDAGEPLIDIWRIRFIEP